MEKHFNVSRYQELLKLEEKGKISLVDENGVLDETFLELLSYRASVESQMGYNRKQDYFSFIHQYLSRVISPSEFRFKFLEMEKEDSKKATLLLEDFQALEVLTLAEDLETFSDLTGKISTLCFEFYEIWDGTIERMSENEFYSLVKGRTFGEQSLSSTPKSLSRRDFGNF